MIATAKASRSIPSGRRPLCAGVVKSEMPLTSDCNMTLTVVNVVANGKIVRRKEFGFRPVTRNALTPLEIA